MNTKWFGKHLWEFGFAVCLNYEPTPERQFYTRQFFLNLAYTLPCVYCRNSYKEFLKQLPIDDYLASNKTITYWWYLMHNKVNNKLRRQGVYKPPDPPFEQVCRHYEQYRAKCNPKTMSCNLPINKKDNENKLRIKFN